MSPDLAQLAAAWQHLPPAIRAGIVAMVFAAEPPDVPRASDLSRMPDRLKALVAAGIDAGRLNGGQGAPAMGSDSLLRCYNKR